MSKIEWLGTPGTVGQFFRAPLRPALQPTAPLQQYVPGITTDARLLRRRAPLTEPAGQWTFEIRFTRGREVASPCGPRLLTTLQARDVAQQFLQVIGFGGMLSGTVADICGVQKIRDLQQEWARLPNGSTVSINASRNGVFRFTVGPVTKGQSLEDFFRQMREQVFSVSGPEEQGDVGQFFRAPLRPALQPTAPLQPGFISPLPRRAPMPTAPSCPEGYTRISGQGCVAVRCLGNLGQAEDHYHCGFADPADVVEVNAFGIQPVGLCIVFASWADYVTGRVEQPGALVGIPQLNVLAGVQKTYETTLSDEHTHRLTLTAQEFATLRAGGTVRKETSRDARPGGRPHTHTFSMTGCGGIAVV